jgi:histone acetyltransferase (RNA polymerase elongator complex component)
MGEADEIVKDEDRRKKLTVISGIDISDDCGRFYSHLEGISIVQGL